ncbi:ribosomal protein S14, S11 [Puccinia graminis f. sp. tritici]|uniref:Ribosomal protein S14, S11 n=1 Tax=Puccinia graminis f. sp. tritici TaxID=56615 RepID=A0A5B0M5F4_PUCGR|nr:ribosomal protein S14, S11 [Puccinia graminis f. sp. tritici]
MALSLMIGLRSPTLIASLLRHSFRKRIVSIIPGVIDQAFINSSFRLACARSTKLTRRIDRSEYATCSDFPHLNHEVRVRDGMTLTSDKTK